MIKNQNGISLLEVMISMIILALGLLGLAPLVVMSIEGNNQSQDQLIASNLAKDRVEFYQNLSPLPAMPHKMQETNLNGNFSRTSKLIDNSVDSTLPDSICNLIVVINWVDKSGISRSSSFETYIEK